LASGGAIDRATVEYVAALSRVELSADELETFSRQLAEILDYINQLNELDTSDVAPLAQAVEVPNVLRDDGVRASLDVDKALANAPERTGQFYKVPAVLD
jgi:aspartyl-tRNA(Asn)/glutamyl-tRNA(Gln) amidotransferase subunit C